MTVYLFTRPTCLFAFGAESLVKYFKLDIKIVDVNSDNKVFNEAFDENNRFTPAIYNDSTKFAINQAVAVNDYLLSLVKDQQGLYGNTAEEKCSIIQWESFINGEFVSKFAAGFLKTRVLGGKLSVEQAHEVVASTDRAASILENHLHHNTFLVGEHITIADIFLGGAIGLVLRDILSPEWRQKHRAIVRWSTTIVKGKYFFNRLGDFKLPTSDPAPTFFDAKPAAKKEEKKKAAKPAAEPAPAAEKKVVHPLAALGPSTIPIDELKRQYSNKETREEALPWFWNTFYNDEEWSIWRVDYKYNDELTLTFMSNNLIGGFFARLTASIKYMFGAAVVYGENNNNGIAGAFVIRGKDFEPVFDVAPDWDSYKFTRLDASNPADRETLDDLWAWDKPLVIDGKPREIADGKVLK